MDLQSFTVYVGLALLSFILADYAERKNSRKSVWLIVISLSLIAGLRNTSVGIDTKTYTAYFNLISDGNIDEIYGMEKSFLYISALLLRIWNNNQFLLFTYAFISHALIIFRIWFEREYTSFKWSVLTYYIMFFAFSLNGMRQFVAVAIVIYATSFLKDGKYAKFIFLIATATLFHTSALIGIAYMLFEALFVRYFDKERKQKAVLIFCLVCIVGFATAPMIINRYIDYFERTSTSVGIMVGAKILLLAASMLLIGKPKEEKYKYVYYTYRLYYFVGLILNSLSYFFLYTGRVGLYFYIFESLYIGNVLKAKTKSVWILFLKVCYVALLMYYMYQNLTSGAQGELPYKFFFQP